MFAVQFSRYQQVLFVTTFLTHDPSSSLLIFRLSSELSHFRRPQSRLLFQGGPDYALTHLRDAALAWVVKLMIRQAVRFLNRYTEKLNALYHHLRK